MPTTILCLDPGITTGWALITTRGRIVDYGQFKAVPLMSGPETGDQDDDRHKFLQQLSGLKIPSVVVMEDFIGSGRRDPHMNNTMKLVGYFLALAHNRFIPTQLQVPQARRPFLVQAEKALSLSKTGAKRHAVDALAHGFKYLHDKQLKNAKA